MFNCLTSPFTPATKQVCQAAVAEWIQKWPREPVWQNGNNMIFQSSDMVKYRQHIAASKLTFPATVTSFTSTSLVWKTTVTTLISAYKDTLDFLQATSLTDKLCKIQKGFCNNFTDFSIFLDL